eukprot:CAMPEP_0171491806 /NCGR_PEP_ID=MMETSP0958-20121227/4060_1 /TAXON_ID=87120 /ORGANISM="Aurantiochytrium limacinum, Strain ATCCMYA-1381" /LENGTH=1969 /DNA_ID=CAMNT_0012025257 /DNA_START=215 /DNA_END=6124 /DNA_ORIENTATION=-
MDSSQRASFCGQFVAQLRMVFLIKTRQPLRFFGELAIPVLLMFALVGIKTTSDEENSPVGIYNNETQQVPDTDDLLSAGWYIANLVEFYSHGFSNMAYVCDTNALQDVDLASLTPILTSGLGSICETPKFVVIPENAGDSSTAQAASDFLDFWVSRYPTLTEQSRLDIASDLITDNTDLDNYITSDQYGTAERPRIGLAVVFQSAGPDWSYYIRVNKTASYGDGAPDENVPSSSSDVQNTDDLDRGTTSYSMQYLMSGFLTVQQEVDSFILTQELGSSNVTLRTNLLAMPTLAYKSDSFWSAAGSTFAIFLVLSLLFPVAMIILEFVSLKETRTRELMYIMGLNPLAYMAAWVTFYLVFYLIMAAVLTGVSMINVFTLAEPSVIFVYFVLFLYSSLSYAFFIAAIFERTTLAIIVGLLIYFIGYFLFIPLSESTAPVGAQILISLIPSSAFSLGTIPFSEYEGGLVPLTWENAGRSSSGGYTLTSCLGMLVFDTILYLVLAIYLDAAIPSSSGAARIKWYWPCLCGCLRSRRGRKVGSKDYAEIVENQTQIENELANNETANFEQVPRSVQELRSEGRCVMINGLTKTFKTPRGKLNANDDISFTIYEGQILALLGHNGAGKTTLSNLLTGVISPTHGDAYIGGNRISSDMAAIRGSLGVCPQANILFPNLTVLEHFKIYAGIKGVPKNEMDKAISEMIAEVGLTPKTNALSKSLSGGMKRKLHLGIALLGNSKLVILDEPTSGQDPYSRTFTWKTIERFREGRTIILTTHYMDEADLLGDRIAIMSEGKLRCIGTSLYLKKIFGVGYQMTIEKADDGNEANRVEVVNMVARHVPSAEVLSDVGTEIMLQLPLAASPKFQPMLAELERNADRLGIVNVGISVTSLENVFLRVAEGTENIFERAKSSMSVGRLASSLSDGGELHEDGLCDSLLKDTEKSSSSVGQIVDATVLTVKPEAVDKHSESKPLSPENTLRHHNTTDSTQASVPVMKLDDEARQIQAQRGSSNLIHIRAILYKRIRYVKRDRTAWCCQLFIPLIFLVLGFLAMKLTFSSDSEAIWFDASTNEWNIDQNLSNPVPFNLGEGESLSASATQAWMDNLSLTRIDRTQSFSDIGPTTTYCRPTELDEQLVYYISALTGQSIPATLIEQLTSGSVPASCTQDSEYNATTLTFSENLLTTTYQAQGSRYGALLFGIVPEAIFGGSSTGDLSTVEAEYTIVYNFTGVNSAPIMMNRGNAALLQGSGSSATISTANFPLPSTKAETEIIEGFSAFSATLALAIAFSFVPSYYAVFIVREKEQRSWHQQVLNGIKPLAYWTANWIFDFCTYLVPMIITWILLVAFDVTALKKEFGATAILFIFYGISITSFTYCCTFMFSNYKYSQFGMILINILGGMVLVIVAFIMTFIESTFEVNQSLVYVYRLLPSFAFCYGLLNVANVQILNYLYNSEERGGDPSNPVDYGIYDMKIAGADMVYLIVESFAYTGLLVLLQMRFRNGLCCGSGCSFQGQGRGCLRRFCTLPCKACQKTQPPVKNPALGDTDRTHGDDIEDEDVMAERERVEGLNVRVNKSGENVVVLQHARKVYPGTALTPDKVAVKDISFGIRHNECFGLLGINGAGKSSTMQMISGEHSPTSGHIYIDSFDIMEQTVSAQQSIGYCPQFDALFDRLTGREHLEFYGRVKGIPEQVLQPLIESTLSEMNLKIHADKLSMTYSGGNKRKLSVAIASLGTPAIIMLDEPSAGVDPAARRFLLDVIARLTKRTSVLLTTHSMEEAEAVSTRIAIMVDGRLRCLGSALRLKTKYGSGFQLEVNLRVPQQDDVDTVVRDEFSTTTHEKLSQSQVLDAVQAAHAKELYENGFCDQGSASALHQQLTVGRGHVLASNLAEWLLVERAFDRLNEILEAKFPGKKLLERVGLRLRYNLPAQENLKLSDMFGIIESAREEAGIQGYSLSVTSLEHIFNTFAARQALVDNSS